MLFFLRPLKYKFWISYTTVEPAKINNNKNKNLIIIILPFVLLKSLDPDPYSEYVGQQAIEYGTITDEQCGRYKTFNSDLDPPFFVTVRFGTNVFMAKFWVSRK